MVKSKAARFLFILAFFFIPTFNNLVNGSSSSEIKSGLFVQGEQQGKLLKELVSLGCSEEETDHFSETLKTNLLKDNFAPDLYKEVNWENHFDAKKYLIKDENGVDRVAVMEIYPPASYGSYFLFLFKNKNNKWWPPIGTVKTDTQYYDSNIFYCRLKNHEFLSLADSTGGTGVRYSWYQMYLIENGWLKKVLEYPSEGQRNHWSLDYDVEYKSKDPAIKKDEKGDYFEVPLNINYYAGKNEDLKIDYEEMKLFSKNYDFCFSWDEEKSQFTLDKDRSDFDKGPEEAILLDGPQEEFLTTYFENLKMLAVGNDKKEKEWLSVFLKNCTVKTNQEKTDFDQLSKLLITNN